MPLPRCVCGQILRAVIAWRRCEAPNSGAGLQAVRGIGDPERSDTLCFMKYPRRHFMVQGVPIPSRLGPRRGGGIKRLVTLYGSRPCHILLHGTTFAGGFAAGCHPRGRGHRPSNRPSRPLIRGIGPGQLGSSELMLALGLSHRPTFRENYLNPALQGGWIERTQPDSPRSPTQRYRLTGKGQRWLDGHCQKK